MKRNSVNCIDCSYSYTDLPKKDVCGMYAFMSLTLSHELIDEKVENYSKRT
jgi:hypothetical protein